MANNSYCPQSVSKHSRDLKLTEIFQSSLLLSAGLTTCEIPNPIPSSRGLRAREERVLPEARYFTKVNTLALYSMPLTNPTDVYCQNPIGQRRQNYSLELIVYILTSVDLGEVVFSFYLYQYIDLEISWDGQRRPGKGTSPSFEARV